MPQAAAAPIMPTTAAAPTLPAAAKAARSGRGVRIAVIAAVAVAVIAAAVLVPLALTGRDESPQSGSGIARESDTQGVDGSPSETQAGPSLARVEGGFAGEGDQRFQFTPVCPSGPCDVDVTWERVYGEAVTGTISFDGRNYEGRLKLVDDSVPGCAPARTTIVLRFAVVGAEQFEDELLATEIEYSYRAQPRVVETTNFDLPSFPCTSIFSPGEGTAGLQES
jgi:hypothetical protein